MRRNRNQPEEATPERSTQHSKQPTHEHGMICGMRHVMHMQDLEKNYWTWPQLGNQECHWKGEVISVEIDIKITGIGCMVRKWQAKQIWHRSAINSMVALRMQQVTMLQHPNIATKHMAVIYKRWLTKDEHWSTARSHRNRFKQAWQKCKRLQVHRLGEKLDMAENSIR